MGKELVGWPHPEGSGQELRVPMVISDRWRLLGNTDDGTAYALSKSAEDAKLCLSAHLKDGTPAQETSGQVQEGSPWESHEV